MFFLGVNWVMENVGLFVSKLPIYPSKWADEMEKLTSLFLGWCFANHAEQISLALDLFFRSLCADFITKSPFGDRFS